MSYLVTQRCTRILAATIRRLGRACDVLVVRLVAAAKQVKQAAAVRGEAAVLELGALRHRGGCSVMMLSSVDPAPVLHLEPHLAVVPL